MFTKIGLLKSGYILRSLVSVLDAALMQRRYILSSLRGIPTASGIAAKIHDFDLSSYEAMIQSITVRREIEMAASLALKQIGSAKTSNAILQPNNIASLVETVKVGAGVTAPGDADLIAAYISTPHSGIQHWYLSNEVDSFPVIQQFDNMYKTLIESAKTSIIKATDKLADEKSKDKSSEKTDPNDLSDVWPDPNSEAGRSIRLNFSEAVHTLGKIRQVDLVLSLKFDAAAILAPFESGLDMDSKTSNLKRADVFSRCAILHNGILNVPAFYLIGLGIENFSRIETLLGTLPPPFLTYKDRVDAVSGFDVWNIMKEGAATMRQLDDSADSGEVKSILDTSFHVFGTDVAKAFRASFLDSATGKSKSISEMLSDGGGLLSKIDVGVAGNFSASTIVAGLPVENHVFVRDLKVLYQAVNDFSLVILEACAEIERSASIYANADLASQVARYNFSIPFPICPVIPAFIRPDAKCVPAVLKGGVRLGFGTMNPSREYEAREKYFMKFVGDRILEPQMGSAVTANFDRAEWLSKWYGDARQTLVPSNFVSQGVGMTRESLMTREPVKPSESAQINTVIQTIFGVPPSTVYHAFATGASISKVFATILSSFCVIKYTPTGKGDVLIEGEGRPYGCSYSELLSRTEGIAKVNLGMGVLTFYFLKSIPRLTDSLEVITLRDEVTFFAAKAVSESSDTDTPINGFSMGPTCLNFSLMPIDQTWRPVRFIFDRRYTYSTPRVFVYTGQAMRDDDSVNFTLPGVVTPWAGFKEFNSTVYIRLPLAPEYNVKSETVADISSDILTPLQTNSAVEDIKKTMGDTAAAIKSSADSGAAVVSAVNDSPKTE